VAEVAIEERAGLAIATIMARQGVAAEAVGAALGVAAPDRPGCAGTTGLTLVATGPGTWLAFADPAPADWAAFLRARLDGLAAVSDQSGGYVVLRVSGAGARGVLQRGLPIDLHPAAFPHGSAAVTVAGHIGVICWQADGASNFHLAVFRSYADSFRHWLESISRAEP
jgi:sarcosine oxidase subunit gamma